MQQRPAKKPSGRVNYFRVLAGGYLLFLAFKIVRDYATGTEDVPLLGLISVVIFVGFGGVLLYLEWRAYQYGVKHIDDPKSWSLEEDEESAEALSKQDGESESAAPEDAAGDAEEETP